MEKNYIFAAVYQVPRAFCVRRHIKKWQSFTGKIDRKYPIQKRFAFRVIVFREFIVIERVSVCVSDLFAI